MLVLPWLAIAATLSVGGCIVILFLLRPVSGAIFTLRFVTGRLPGSATGAVTTALSHSLAATGAASQSDTGRYGENKCCQGAFANVCIHDEKYSIVSS